MFPAGFAVAGFCEVSQALVGAFSLRMTVSLTDTFLSC